MKQDDTVTSAENKIVTGTDTTVSIIKLIH